KSMIVKKSKTSEPNKNEETPNEQGSQRPRRLRVRVVGIGGGGVSIIGEMANPPKATVENGQYLLGGVSFWALDTDARVFQKAKKNIRVLQFGEKTARGSGTGMNIDLAQKSAEEDQEKIVKILKDQDIIILVGCLGGGVASGAGPLIAKMAQEQKAVTLGIFTLPFGFEGDKKMLLAKKAAEKLRENLSGIIIVPNEKIFQIADKKMPLKKSFSALNQIFATRLNGLLEIILKPSLINIDFADLRTILESKGAWLFLGQSITHGQSRAEEAVKNIFHNQLFDSPPKVVNRILYNITGGKDLNIKEVEMISQSIAQLNPKAKIIFGLSQDQKYANKLKVTILAVSDGEKRRLVEKPLEVVKKNKKKIRIHLRKGKSSKFFLGGNKKESKTEGGDNKETFRQSGLEVKEAEQAEAQKELAKEVVWEIPAFLKKRM
ncbi:MAG: cell division protein FtsZ, partial [Candidatus Gribaldobacteria bacterium]|nr:cell division protein FtsZ [Candidatus Gribaldobacteria bacterium]